jgi:hypothetical protein
MTLTDVANLIASFGVSWRYSHFSQTPNPPYVVYYYPSENDVHADDINYVNRRQLFIELYTKSKDVDLEAGIEAKLKGAGLSWYKQTDFLNDEKLFQTTYELEVIING